MSPLSTLRHRYRHELQAYAFLGPALCLLLVLMIYPLGQVVRMSFYDITVRTETWAGLGNYAELLGNPLFWQILWQTVLFTVGSVVMHLVIGLGLALLLHTKINVRIRNLFRGLLIVPWLFAPTVAGMIWVLMLNPFGILNGFLTTIGLLDPNQTINWLGNPQTSLLAVTVVNIWRAFPFFMVMLLAGLQAIPEDVYEAGDIDGTTPLQKFWYITIPALRGVILTIVLLDSIWTFRAFDLVYVMTGGGPVDSSQVLPTSIYFDAFQKLKFGYASAEAIAMLLILLVFSVAYVRRAVKA
ncbi:MAG: sugar ABC transporter permease [candidate division NC10 bacterium]|nr:sugar ABC transporter permease [candidate division NC10 bacterium]MBI2117032.1 sugar ABC transporter permease [candidate division NC10 bacterium]MBI2456902.1 sugar ABC transporter permease [candidate division NC10 bacterium]MBI2561670.1 sugar ABC transporter permease [candidate division NC10 bacterium]